MIGISRRRLTATLTGFAFLPAVLKAAATRFAYFDVREFGAVGDGTRLNTKAIQKTIDTCASRGGGTVSVSQGKYVTGTLFLKSNVTLSVESGGLLLASPRIEDYAQATGRNMYAHEPQLDRCLIFSQDAVNIGIHGLGTIDGQGKSFPNEGDPGRSRPMLLRLVNCNNVSLRDITLQNPAAWTSAFLYCSDIRVDGINISSRARGNGDGLDFDGCQNVRVSNCRLDTSDDSICLQTSEASKPVRNVVITNCIMTSQWAAIRIGLLSRGAFEDVTVSNCIFHDIRGEAIKIQLAEGGRMENFLFSNIVMRDVPRPLFLTFNSFPFRVDSPGELPPMQSLKNITFSDMRIAADRGADAGRTSFFALLGLPGHPIENIRFNNIAFIAPGGGTAGDAARRNIPELDGVRPEREPLGTSLPSYGLFARHVRGLTVTNVTFQTLEQDCRAGIFCDDVVTLKMSNVGIGGGPDNGALVVLKNARNVTMQGCYPLETDSTFLRVEGRESAEIALVDNDLRSSRRMLDQDAEVSKDAVKTIGNLTSFH